MGLKQLGRDNATRISSDGCDICNKSTSREARLQVGFLMSMPSETVRPLPVIAMKAVLLSTAILSSPNTRTRAGRSVITANVSERRAAPFTFVEEQGRRRLHQIGRDPFFQAPGDRDRQ
jgi:hypothetical protein